MSYVVIENTPGYLPDDDDPAVFDDLFSAREYMRDEVERLCDHIAGGDGDPVVTWYGDDADGDPKRADGAYVVDETREHDLGRVFDIIESDTDAF